ncbi:MAG: SEC-C domain-containing protein [Bacillota bacterium]
MSRKTGRNVPCWCGSGMKFKHCHWPAEDPVKSAAAVEARGVFGAGPLAQTIGMGGPARDSAALLTQINQQKRAGTRPFPSATLISFGDTPPASERGFLVDLCARLVDENWCGRSEMCIYFAVLLRHGLNLLGHQAVVEVGKARYTGLLGRQFEWDHAWVRTQYGDIVDGNIDSIRENPMVPAGIEPKPYWGPENSLPSDRVLNKSEELTPERDERDLDRDPLRIWKAAVEKAVLHYVKSQSVDREGLPTQRGESL